MPLLLLLSAILTALTGAVAGGRPLDVQIARQAVPADARTVAVVAGRSVSGHAHLLGAFGMTAAFATLPAVPNLAMPAPRLYVDRPRA